MEFFKKELDEIKSLIKAHNIHQKKFLTVNEAAKYLSLSESQIYKMGRQRVVPSYCPGGKKLYFKRHELDQWLASSRVDSTIEVESDVMNYISGNNKNLPL